jgi:3-oxoacyl-[acyl-carrier-protein] synthase II
MPATPLASPRAGFFLGTAMGAVAASEEQSALFHARGERAVEPSFAFCASPHSAATLAASDYGIVGPVSSMCSECPAGLDAIATAWDRLRRGELDVALAGGADAPLSPMLFAAYTRAGILASDAGPPDAAGRPFDRRRSGFVLGEAGAMLALETLEHAHARGARVYGELAGFGWGRDRPTFVASANPSGEGILAAALGALEASHLAPFDLECVSAHATGLRSTDLAEIRAMRTLLGSRRRSVPVTSIKGALGHPLAAAGVLQLATALLALSHDTVPATRNCDELDAECDLDVVRHAPRSMPLNTVLTNTHGFGGSTTAVVARRIG